MTEVIVWSGWIGGIAVGLYFLFQLMLTGNQLGVSTAFGNVCALVSKQPYFKSATFSKASSWRTWFFLGLPLGGLVAALTSPGPIVASFSLGALYDTVLPTAVWAKALVLIVGGFCMGFGARLAGGCTSGHAISGMALLSLPSVVAACGFFVGGIIAVQTMFRVFAG